MLRGDQLKDTASEVRVRPAYPFDSGRILAWRAEASVGEFQPLDEHGAAAIRRDFSSGLDQLAKGEGTRFGWIIEAPRPVGWVSLAILSWDHGLAEVGYALTHEARGRGIMSAALSQVLDVIFSRSKLYRIEARCDLRNQSSIRVLEANRFQREGTLREYFMLDGQRRDSGLFALLRTDWQERLTVD